MPTFDLEFEVFCTCGEGLCNQSDTRTSRNRNYPQVVVEPCQKCLDSAKDDGYEEGYDKGKKSAEEEYKDVINELESRIKELGNNL